ncbi:MafI family immunity protein [Archangium gephyra]|uniref:MafI family immunity protein n=1 Tax=Archangium gephyra TaxID=48 RepID=UPI0035D452AA
MGLAKKGTRLLTIEGARYRWVVAPNDEPGLGIVVEAADLAGQRMVTWVEHGTAISPWLVREAILHALSQGWSPRERGPERVFRWEAPSIRKALGERLDARLSQLCDAFQERVAGVEDVRDLARHGERGIAFETLCSHILDADEPPALSLAEFEQLAAFGEGIGCRSAWVDLAERLTPKDREHLPPRLRTLAANQLTGELASNPNPHRREWLERLRAVIMGRGGVSP